MLAKDSGIWQWAIFSFILAGVTGFLYRLGFVTVLPFDLNLENIRHAHSHLMFFGWASLLPLYLIKIDSIPGYHAAIGARFMKYSLWAVLLFGLISFPFFFIWGYKSVSIGDANLPFSVIFSGLVMVGWYGFMIGYLFTRNQKHDFVPNVWFEGALMMLFISSLGAWGVGAVEMLHIGGPLLGKALTHFFLATFVEGWVLLVLLGLIYKALNLKEDDLVVSPLVLVGLIAIGAPLTFPYGISESMLSLNLSVAARMGGILIAEGTLLFLYSVFRSRRKSTSIWIWPLLFLGLKAVMQLIASVSPADLWLSEHGVRVFYLHVLLLGAFTTGMIGFLKQDSSINNAYFYGVLVSVSIVLISLILLTSFWPAFLSGVWIYYGLAVTALLPVIAVLVFWLKLNKTIVH
ncbi:MAG: hypothetical protein HUJ22_00540 [Gracilimonas sp.]|uniref:hypothetical protein n=1 Tax=Gracilimonas sp. TaxID=1974203 RepID=UPI0019C7D76A|nr:hypothetical protein [Gracilimonas sp.]MBD3615027.1 hypothetical protein [Gracilimonas sp.]